MIIKLSILELITKALAKREILFKQFSCYRIFDGNTDGILGLIVERFQEILVLRVYEQQCQLPNVEQQLQTISSELAKLCKVKAVVIWWHAKSATKSYSKLVWGEIPEPCFVTEHGLKFQIYPKQQLNLGFFIDTRLLRLMLLKQLRSQRVLNLFAYSGTLGIAALCAGAGEVVQVDVSKTFLGWAAKNAELNQEKYHGKLSLINEDVRSYLEKQHRRVLKESSKAFDLVICDAPAFGSGKEGNFVLNRDLELLLQSILSVCTNSARIVLCTNLQTLSGAELESRSRETILQAKYKLNSCHHIAAPEQDFLANNSAMRGVILDIEHPCG